MIIPSLSRHNREIEELEIKELPGTMLLNMGPKLYQSWLSVCKDLRKLDIRVAEGSDLLFRQGEEHQQSLFQTLCACQTSLDYLSISFGMGLIAPSLVGGNVNPRLSNIFGNPVDSRLSFPHLRTLILENLSVTFDDFAALMQFSNAPTLESIGLFSCCLDVPVDGWSDIFDDHIANSSVKRVQSSLLGSFLSENMGNFGRPYGYWKPKNSLSRWRYKTIHGARDAEYCLIWEFKRM